MMRRLLLFRMRRHMVAYGLKCPNIGSWSFWLEPADMLSHVREVIFMFDPAAVKEKCNGMLSPSEYGRIYDLAKNAPGESFIEVGAAHGAATVSLASALRDSGRVGKVYSFEKITGGSRERFGNFGANKTIIEDNIACFGVGDRIVMNYGLVEELAPVIPGRKDFGLMMLDADGKIDRNFSPFFDKLADNAVTIIDDVSPAVRARTTHGALHARRVFVDQKHRL